MSFNDWPETIFDELIESVSETQKYRIEKMVLINTSDVYDGKVLNHKYVDTNDIPGQFKKKFQYGDILYSEIRPANKRYAFVDFDSRDYIASTKLMVLRNKNALVNNRFLFHVLKSSNVINELQTIAESRSGTFPQITFSELARLKIKLPKLSEQIKIAQMLDDIDYKIELNNKINKTLEEMAQAIFKSWFVDFERSKDDTFTESVFGLVPQGWNVMSLDDVLTSIETGDRPKGGVNSILEGIPSIGAENVIGLGKYNYSSEKYVSVEYYEKLKRGKVRDWDILLYKDGASLGRKTIVGSGYPHSICCVNSHVFILRSNSLITQIYLYFWLDQDAITQKIIGLNTSSAQPGINQPAVKSLKILVPPKNMVEDFDKIVQSILKQLFNLSVQNRKLAELRDTLLPKLMSGEIRIPLEEVPHAEVR